MNSTSRDDMQQLELRDDAGSTYVIRWRLGAISDPSAVEVVALDAGEAQRIHSVISEATSIEPASEENAQDEPYIIVDISPATGEGVIGGRIRIPMIFEELRPGEKRTRSFSLRQDNQADLRFESSAGTANVSLSPCNPPAGKSCSATGSNGSVSSISNRKMWTITVTGSTGNSTVTITGDYSWTVQ